jgi:hypothetical protein
MPGAVNHRRWSWSSSRHRPFLSRSLSLKSGRNIRCRSAAAGRSNKFVPAVHEVTRRGKEEFSHPPAPRRGSDRAQHASPSPPPGEGRRGRARAPASGVSALAKTRRASMAAARGKGPAPGLDPRRSTAALRPSHARGEQLYHEIWDLQDSDCRLRQLGQPHRPSIPCCIFTCYGLDGWGGRIRRGICVRWPSAIVPCGKVRSCTICCHSLRRTIAVDPNWAQFLMRRFESCRPSQAVRSLPANVGKHRSNGVARLLRWRYQSSAWPRRHWRDPTGDVWSLPGNV